MKNVILVISLILITSFFISPSYIFAQQSNVLNLSEGWFSFKNPNGTFYNGSINMDLYEVISFNPLITKYIENGSSTSNVEIGAYVEMQNDCSHSVGNKVFGTTLNYNKDYIIVLRGIDYIYLPLSSAASKCGDIGFVYQLNSSGSWNLEEYHNGRGISYSIGTWNTKELSVQNIFDINGSQKNNILYVNGYSIISGTTLHVNSGSTYNITAVEQPEYNNSKYLFDKWDYDNTTNQYISIEVNQNTLISASFNIAYRISIQSDFDVEGIGGGIINVEGLEYSVPGNSIFYKRLTSVNLTAPTQQHKNDIWCTFSHWSDNSTSNTRTLYVNEVINLTAYYTPTIARVDAMAAHIVGNVGDFVKIDWNEHPSTNVTQYQVWRKLKNGTEEMLILLPRGNTEYTDGQYKIKYGSDATTLFYAVTPYYLPSNTWSPKCYDITSGEYFVPEAKVNNGLAFSSTSSFSTMPSMLTIENFPNPFNPTTTLNYQLPQDNHISIKVYDVTGKEVAELVNENKTAGYYNVNFDASKLPSGIYICTITSGNYSLSKKMILLK